MVRHVVNITEADLDVFTPAKGRDREIHERFREFHEAHPEIFDYFRELAHQLYNKGFRKYSADALLHALRWAFDTKHGPDGQKVEGGFYRLPKVNDHYASRYARLLAVVEAKFEAFFGLRALQRD